MKALILRKFYLTLASCFVFICVQTEAQQISGGFEFALPNEGDALEDVVVAGFGLSARYEKKIAGNWSGLVDGGFILFTGKNRGGPILTIPVQAGTKYYLQKNGLGFYGIIQLGAHSFAGNAGAYGTNFSYAPGMGYCFKNWDVSVRYEKIISGWISASYIAVRVGYIFRGKN